MEGWQLCPKRIKRGTPKKREAGAPGVGRAEARNDSAREHACVEARRPEEGLEDGREEAAAPAAEEQKRVENGAWKVGQE